MECFNTQFFVPTPQCWKKREAEGLERLLNPLVYKLIHEIGLTHLRNEACESKIVIVIVFLKLPFKIIEKKDGR